MLRQTNHAANGHVTSTHKDAEYYLSLKQLESLIDGAQSARDKIIVTILVDTGLRRFEAANLKFGDFNLTTNLLTVRHGKGNRMRQVPISPRLRHMLSEFPNCSPDSPLLPGRTKGELSTRQINRIVADAGKCARIESPNPKHRNITCHLIRHSFARHWKDAGGNIEALARILGHASVKTTWDLYGIQTVEDVKKHYQLIMQKRTKQMKEERHP